MFDGERLFKALSTVTTKEIEAARQDKTVIAEIVEIENVDSGKYKVEYQGNTFSALSTNLDIVYKEGEQVYVLVPQGDFSSQKLILGYSSYKGKEEESNLTNFYVDGSELVGNTGLYTLLQSELGICAGKINGEVPDEEYGFNLNSLSSIPQEILKIMDSVQIMSKTYDYIKISGDFKTNFVETHETGEYSLKIGLLCLKQDTDEAEGDYIINELSLGFSTFTGAPYSYIEYTPQTAYFAIPKGSVCGLAYIKLTQQGFVQEHIPKTETLFTNDNIFVRNIEISFAQKINLADTLWYAYLTTPKGTQVNSQNPNIKLMPHLLYKGHDVFNTDNCEVYWFRQKADITIADVEEQDKDEHNKTWFDYGGNGWYPISKFIDDKGLVETAEEESVVETDINVDNLTYHYSIEDDGSLIINQAAVPFKWQYKAVIVYRDTSTNEYSTQEFPLEPITIVNTESEYDLEIEKYIDGLFSTYLRIRNHKKDPYGDQMALDGRPYREWFGTYWLERVDGSYEMVSEEYFLGKYNINRFLSAPIARFYIQCYDPYIIDPQNKAALLSDPKSPYTDNNISNSLLKGVGEVADLVFECANIDDSELTVSWSGRDSFHYNTDGQLKSWIAERDNVIKLTLKWLTNSVSSYTLVVYGPGGAELTRRDISDNNYFEQNSYENTYDCDESMMLGMYIDQDRCIHFKVREQFDESKTDNTFKLEISLSGRSEPFEIYKTITFTKDGDQGTMGSEWAAPIYPCNYAVSTTNQVKFTARLDSQQTTPLVVVFDPADSTAEWTQWDGSRIVLRPFITKNGIRIEEMDPYEGYFYRCYWDVRTPNSINNALAKNASFLRLYRVASGETTTAEGYNTRVFSGFWSEGTQHNQNENHPDGLVAKTGYPVSLEDSGQDNAWPENYGAVEVRFFDNRCPDFTGSTLNQNENNTIKYKGTGATLEDMQYRFVVKCQIDIFKGQYDKATNMIHESGDNVKVASITSFYPIDMIFTTSAELSREGSIVSSLSKKMQTNWPRFIQYNSSGYDPVTNIDKEGLYLVIGDEDKSKLTNYLGENLTPLIQEIENRADEEGNITQVYKPSTHLNMTEGFCGAIRTTPGAAFFNDEQSFFVRNQVMYLNSFANVDINGWDGQSIETDEDNGSIFAATFGAGFKEPTTNLFTGVVMGMDKSQKRELFKGENYDADYIRSHPYMTGIFGFQDGVSSFGLMENGTGFFGRPDRGGRILFDGSNATMYGGANGTMGSPSIGDPMWNTMRLSFVDLTHQNSSISMKGANGQLIEQGFNGEYFKDSKLSNRTSDNYMPRWYKKMWEHAYIKPNGELPYWYSKDGQVVKWEDLDWYMQDVEDSIHSNRRIDYYSGETNGNNISIFTGIDEDKLERQRTALKYAKEQYDIDPKGYYATDTELEVLENIVSYKGLSKSAVYLKLLDIISQANILSGFGAARSSTTPAIEVGQHIDGLMPGIFDWDDYESIFKELRIPGNRNFMVTYDGTMWAMNGVFMGAIIGSNIVGGRIQGAEIGIGTENSNLDIYTISETSLAAADYSNMFSPTEENILTSRALLELKGGGRNLGFYVSSSGEVVANNISIYGGKIDVGHFHILGSEQEDYKERGHLIQNATSDFIGETHCYGGLTVSPSETMTSNSRSNYGNFFQTHGTVALGISKDKHSSIVSRFWNTDTTGEYGGYSGEGLDGDSFNQCCFFGLDTAEDSKYKYQGHFWPLSFKLTGSNGLTMSYATVMDIFQNGDSNYFRIGPWGTEGVQHFIKTGFQNENSCEEPNNYNSLGYVGNIGGRIGIYAWENQEILLIVGENSGIRISKDNIIFSSHGKTYTLDDLARGTGNDAGITITKDDQGDDEVQTEPNISTGSSTRYYNKQPPSGFEPGPDTIASDQGKWEKKGSYYYYYYYDVNDNQYHQTGTIRYAGN